MSVDDRQMFDLARKLAKEAADKYGEEFWTVRDVHINAARRQLAAEAAPLKKVIPTTTWDDAELMRKALESEAAHAVGLRGPHHRLEFGPISTSFGELVVSHNRDGNSLNVHSVEVPLNEIDVGLRDALVETSAKFAAAESSAEQSGQKKVISALVDSILRYHPQFGNRVRDAKTKERYLA